MKLSIIKSKQIKEITISHRKENNLMESYLVIDCTNKKVLIDCRLYMPGSTNVYCCLWTHFENDHRSASGQAGGGGYHKPSAAVEYALTSMGYQGEDIAGRGNEAIEQKLKEIAEYEGHANIMVLRAHG